MANASSNDALHPTGKQVTRSYLLQRTPKVQFLPPEDVIKLMSRNRVRCNRTVVRKPSRLEVQRWNQKTICSLHSRTARSGTLVSRTNNQTGKAHQESIQTPKPPADRSDGSKSCLLKSNPKTNSNRCGASVIPHQKPEFGVPKKKGQEKAPAHKRISAHEDGPNHAKLTTRAEVEGCNP